MIEKTEKIHILEPDKLGVQGRFGNAHDIAVIKALDAFSVDRAEGFVDFVGSEFHFDDRTVGKDDSARIDAHIRADRYGADTFEFWVDDRAAGRHAIGGRAGWRGHDNPVGTVGGNAFTVAGKLKPGHS